MYFGHPDNGDAYLMIDGCQENPLILGPNITLKLWINPANPGTGRRLQLGNNRTLLSTSSCATNLSISNSQTEASFSTSLSSGSNNVTTLNGGPSLNTWSNISMSSNFSTGLTTNTLMLNG